MGIKIPAVTNHFDKGGQNTDLRVNFLTQESKPGTRANTFDKGGKIPT